MTRTPILLLIASIMAVGAGCASDTGGGGASCSPAESEVCQVFEIVNAERSDQGLEPYGWDDNLALAAQRHAEDMVDQDYFSHDSLDGRSFVDRINETDYDASPRGENIAAGQQTPASVMEAWMNSDGHRRNILSEGSNEIGVGLEGRHWVQVFGHRRPVTTTEE